MIHIPYNMKIPSARIDVSKMTKEPVDAGNQATMLKNPDGITQGESLHLVTCGAGCSCSPGCKNCYYEAVKEWVHRHGKTLPPVEVIWENLCIPYRWKKRKNVFLCSSGDIFHRDVPDDFIGAVETMVRENQRHNFILSTKRPQRMHLLHSATDLSNLYVGVSIEGHQFRHRAEALLRLPRNLKRVLFFAPLLTPIRPEPYLLEGIDWAIIIPEKGGEGRTPRPCREEWIQDLIYQLEDFGIPIFLDVKYSVSRIARLGRHMEFARGLLD